MIAYRVLPRTIVEGFDRYCISAGTKCWLYVADQVTSRWLRGGRYVCLCDPPVGKRWSRRVLSYWWIPKALSVLRMSRSIVIRLDAHKSMSSASDLEIATGVYIAILIIYSSGFEAGLGRNERNHENVCKENLIVPRRLGRLPDRWKLVIRLESVLGACWMYVRSTCAAFKLLRERGRQHTQRCRWTRYTLDETRGLNTDLLVLT